jgi:Zn-dependent M28 family amino/carboxypeptidase
MKPATRWLAIALATGPVLMIGCVPPDASVTPAIDTTMTQAAQRITGPLIREVVAEIASDAYQGRAPGTKGDRMTRDYLSARLRDAGLAPGAGGSWQQPFKLIGVSAAQPDSWTFNHGSTETRIAQHDEFIAASGLQAPVAELREAELVFVGYGISAPEHEWDDYAGRNLKGKVLVMLNNDPHWDPELFAGERRLYYGRWMYKYEIAAARGAAGAIIIHTTESAGYPWSVIQSSFSGPRFELPQRDEPRLAIKAWMKRTAVARLMAAAGFELDELIQHARHREFTPIPLGITTSLTLHNDLTEVSSGNVLGLLRGSDPDLARELVVYTAHHDHLGVRAGPDLGVRAIPDLGVGTSGDGDQIYNGALDNASGTAMVVAIAEAFAALSQPPRRSVLFAFVGAEEQGLLGSQFYAENPTVAPGRIAANINYDVGNKNGRASDVIYIGLGKSSLDAIAQRVADYQQRTLKPDQDPDKGLFYRSDQINFARIGVPALYVKGGRDIVGHPGQGDAEAAAYLANHYHRPSDELTDDWNFDGMVDDARFGFLAGLLIANADELPVWNSGDEFEAARKAALARLTD